MNTKNIFGALCVAAALFFLWPAVIGAWSEMSALKAALAERKQIETERAAILDQYAKEYAKLKQMSTSDVGKKFSAMVPVGKGTPEMVSAMQDIATTSGVQLVSTQVETTTSTTAEQPYRMLSLKLELKGSYPSFKAFLKGLEEYVRVLNVKKLEIGQGTGTEADGSMNFTLTAEAYFIN